MKMEVKVEPISRTAAWAKKNGIDRRSGEAAAYYLKNYETRWSSWLPEETFKKVKSAVWTR